MSLLMPLKIRGAISIKDMYGWEGVFKKETSQPSLFGNMLWDLLQKNYNRLGKWGKDLLKYGYWSDYMNEGLCPYCGKHGNGQPNNIKAELIVRLHLGELAPDPDMIGHTHLSPVNKINKLHEEMDGLWIEWVYVIDPKTYTLEVYKSVRCEGTIEVIQLGHKYPQSKFRYCGVGLFSLFSEEPNWEEVESRGLQMSSYYHKKFPPFRQSVKKFQL